MKSKSYLKNPITIGIILNLLLSWCQSIFVQGSAENSSINEFVSTSPFWLLVILWILIVLIIPVIEELLFRGILWRGFLYLMSPSATAVAVGLFFCFLHPMESALFLLPFSAYLSWLRLSSGSLKPGIVAHVSFNTTGLIVPYILSYIAS